MSFKVGHQSAVRLKSCWLQRINFRWSDALAFRSCL